MGAEITPPCSSRSLLLLELAAMDDLDSFKGAVEDSSQLIDEPGLWYTRHTGSKSSSMSYQLRTPLMVSAQYGSVSVLDYIIQSGNCNVNLVLGLDQVTALHCAISGGSQSAPTVVDRLLSASAEVDSRVADLVSCFPKFMKQQRLELELLLLPQLVGSGYSSPEPESEPVQSPQQQPGSPVLPDINNGVYGTDEFRMYCFKIVPCSRAYTHDWTECPFAHPGENAKRRDPKKHPYTCVPCPEFKKGSCRKGDDCEFAHGVFESWLHPAQYRTRLCKDEIGCARKVCFFAHKKDELRPVYQSTGSAIPGPEMGNHPTNSVGLSTPPLSPSFSPKGSYSPTMISMGGPPPSLQLPGSRLRSSLSARDVDFGRELMKMEQQFLQQQQQQVHSPRPSPRPTNLESVFASINVSRKLSPPKDFDSSPKSLATAMLNSRSAAFAKRSQSFIDRPAPGGGYGGAPVSDWGSPNGKLEWGMKGEELNKLRKSNSFGFRGSNVDGVGVARTGSPPGFNEPDVSWVNSLVKDEVGPGFFVNGGGRRHGGSGGGKGGQIQPWVEQLYIEQEQLVA